MNMNEQKGATSEARIPTEMTRLSNEVAKLESIIEILSKRLAPVSRSQRSMPPMSPNDKEKIGVSNPASKIASEIGDKANTIAEATDTLTRILENLEI